MSFWDERPSTLNVLTCHTWRGSGANVRVYVDHDTASVWGEEGNSVVRLYDATIKDLRLNNGVWILTTDADEVWPLDSCGCGCGSPLKAFNPARALAG